MTLAWRAFSALSTLVFLMSASIANAADFELDILEPNDGIARGLQARVMVKLTNGGPTWSDLDISIWITDPAACVLSDDENTLGTGALVVTVPTGKRRAPFQLQARAGSTAQCVVNIDPVSGYLVKRPTVLVNTPTPTLRYRRLDTSVQNQRKSEPFHVEIGVDETIDGGFDAQGITTGSCDVTACSGDTNIFEVTDGTTPGPCAVASITNNSHRTNTGDLALVPNPALATTESANLTTDADCFDGPLTESAGPLVELITVSPAAANIRGPAELAENHQDTYTLRLRPPPSGAVTATLTSSDTNACLLSATGEVAGAGTAYLYFEANQGGEKFAIQGVSDASCDVTVTVPGYVGVTREIDVDPQGISIRRLERGYTLASGNDRDDDFFVLLGTSSRNGVARRQPVSFATMGQDVTVSSGDAAIAVIEEAGVDAASQTVTVPPGKDRVESGSFAVEAKGNGCTPITAEVGDGTDIDASSDAVEICVDLITANIIENRGLAPGLEYPYVLKLSEPAGSVTTVNVLETSPYCDLVDPATSVVGNTAAVTFEVGKRRSAFVARGVEGITGGDCEVTWTATGDPVEPGGDTIVVAEGVLRYRGLASRRTTTSEPDEFFVQTANSDRKLQAVRGDFSDAAGLLVTVCSADANIVAIGDGTTSGACATAYVTPGGFETLRGDLLSIAGNQGCTTVTTTAAGLEDVEQEICVRAESTNIEGPGAVGRDLQDTYRVKLRPRPTTLVGIDLSVVPLIGGGFSCALSDDPLVLGSDQLTVWVEAGASAVTFEIQGIDEGAGEEECTILAVPQSGIWGDASETIAIRKPGLRLVDLAGSSYVGATDSFQIEVGVATPSDARLQRVQRINPGADIAEATGQTVQACSGDVTKAEINNAQCASTVILTGESISGSGALLFKAFDETPGVEVCASAPGFLQVRGACRDVEITLLTIVIDPVNGVTAIGAGLMDTARLKASESLTSDVDVTVNVDPEDVGKCFVSPDEETEGAATMIVAMLAGSTKLNFQIHATERLQSPSEQCRLHVDSALSPADYEDFDVVTAAAKLADVPSGISAGASNNAIKVVLGTAKTKTNMAVVIDKTQKVRWRDTEPGLDVEVCSLDEEVGKLDLRNANAPAECKTVLVAKGMDHSRLSSGPDNERLQFDPNEDIPADGVTVVRVEPEPINDPARETDFDVIAVDDGEREIEVRSLAETLSLDTVDVGKGLTSGSFRIEASDANPNITVTVSVRSGDESICLVALSASEAGATSKMFLITKNQTGPKGEEFFYVQGVSIDTCQLEITTDDSRYPLAIDLTEDVSIVQPAIALSDLVITTNVNTSDAFKVEVGTPDSGGTGLAEVQSVRVGESIDVTVDIDDPALAELEVGGNTSSSFDLTIPQLASDAALTLNVFGTTGVVLVDAVGTNPGEIDATPDATQSVLITTATGGCGLGFEIMPVLGALYVWRSRQRRRNRRD